ncbi:MAG: hypothetical protein GEU96_02280 [Propionibacteriales bacterium]|nr:hypothetical protein [Propionibacteriales bacterium]
MRSTYRALAGLIAIGVVLQAATIALAWFGVMNDVDGGAVYDEGTEYNAGQSLHAILGMIVIPVLALLLMIVSFFTKVPGAVKWAGLVLLVVVVQVLLAFASFGAPILGTLHGANALVVMGAAGMASRRVQSSVGAPEQATAQPTAGAGAGA